jgi:DNA-binding IclR family transcriptional regulator
MSGLKRYTKVLRQFSETDSNWTVPNLAAALNVPQSTIYRTVRELVSENLLELASEGSYRLGSAFIEFDRLVRVTDPIHELGLQLLREVVLQSRLPCIAALARVYGDTVMCVADARSADCVIKSSYERGRPRPLTRGATSKAILAQLPTRRLNKLLDALDPSKLPPFVRNREEFREELAAIRRRGYAIGRGEVDSCLIGIAAPVSIPELALAASLSIIVEAKIVDDATERRLTLLAVSSASLLTEQLKLRIRKDEQSPREGFSRQSA